jgi:hypothetical protein
MLYFRCSVLINGEKNNYLIFFFFFSATNEIKSNASTKYPTVWLGSGDGWLYIHSAIGEHRKTIEKVWLRHAIYSIV